MEAPATSTRTNSQSAMYLLLAPTLILVEILPHICSFYEFRSMSDGSIVAGHEPANAARALRQRWVSVHVTGDCRAADTIEEDPSGARHGEPDC